MEEQLKELSLFTVQELKTICKSRKITGYSNKKKAELMTLLCKEHTTSPSPTECTDKYDMFILAKQYQLHKNYVINRMKLIDDANIKIRLPSIPEDISENIIKFIIHMKLKDTTTSWSGNTGDLKSSVEGRQECKCFTSDGPISFTPSSNWDVIYFLDAREWLENKFICYRVVLTRTCNVWQKIKISKTQTFEEQTNQGRRPRITWKELYPQIKEHCTEIFNDNITSIITQLNDLQ